MDYPIEVILQRPVTVDGKTIDKLVFDEPDLGTSIAVEEAASHGEQIVLLLSGMADLDRKILLKVKESDYREIRRKVLDPYTAHISEVDGVEAGNG